MTRDAVKPDSHAARRSARMLRHATAAALLLGAGPAGAGIHAVTADAADPAAIVPVFDCYRTNSAWGFTLSGKVVDADGTIWSYSRRGQPWLPQQAGAGEANYLGAADLHAKYAGAKSSGKVDVTVLQQQTALIAKAAEGKVTRADTGVRDAGTSTCHAYLADAAKARYRDVELGSDGGVADSHFSNAAAEAMQLIDWLRSIGVAK